MKKLAMSLATIALVSTLAMAATRAYFTGSTTTSDNTFAAGTLTLSVKGPNNQTTRIFSLQNLHPGSWDATGTATLKNTGTVKGEAWMEITNVRPKNGVLGNLVKISVEKNKDWWHRHDMPQSLNRSIGDRIDLGDLKKNESMPVTIYAIWPNGSPAKDNPGQGQTATFDVVFHLDQKM